jgi:hypothetical protein
MAGRMGRHKKGVMNGHGLVWKWNGSFEESKASLAHMEITLE